jgi:hypothetical protein
MPGKCLAFSQAGRAAQSLATSARLIDPQMNRNGTINIMEN